MDILTAYSWPGNVRELQNLMERMVILCKNPNIDVGDLPSYLSGDIGDSRFVSETLGILLAGVSLESYVKQFEFRVLLQTLKKYGFNKTRAAEALGLKRSTFRYKLSKAAKNLHSSMASVN